MPKLFEAFNPHKMFHGSFVPEWLESRPVKECSPGAKLIYARMTRYAGKNGECYPPIETIALATGYKKRQVENIIKELKDLKLIKAIRVGKKCTNRYLFLWHPWIAEAIEIQSDTQNSADHKNSDTQNSADPMDTQNSADPQKENQERESNNICNFSKKSGKAKINEQIKEVFDYWQKEVNQPTWSLTKLRISSIRSALMVGIKRVDKVTLEEYEEPLTVKQLKELITLTFNDQHMRDGGWIDLQNILTQKRMTAYVEGRLNKNSTKNKQKTFDMYNVNV